MKKSYFISILFHLLLLCGAIFLWVRHEQNKLQGNVSLQWYNLAPQEKAGEEEVGSKTPQETTQPVKTKPQDQGKTVTAPQALPTGGEKKGNAGESKVSSGSGNPDVLSAIRSRILKYKIYPPMALRQELQGTVVVSFNITQAGEVFGLKVLSSSGHALLDEGALQTVKKAAPFPYYPDTINLGMKYEIEE
ncbi:energy transducer TonB [bacterium]|nr:energy transducer TonB [bacterium]